MPYQPGEVLLNKYRIEKLLGEGAFGEVYLASHVQLGAKRALKVLRRDAPGMGSTFYKDCHERFKREAQLGARIDDNYVISVHDLEPLEPINDKGGYVLVMEYAPGDTLRRRLDKAREEKKPLEVEEALRIALDAARGLAALHALDVVHRDVKPSNIFFGEDGRAKIGDLGLTQFTGGFSRRDELDSLAEKHPGTPAYMSPEQDASVSYLTTASDIYSLGVVLFEMLTLRSYRILPGGARLSDFRVGVTEQLEGLMEHMLEKDPEFRLKNGGEAARESENVLQGMLQEKAAREQELQLLRLQNERQAGEARRKAEDKGERQAVEQKRSLEIKQAQDREAREKACREEARRKTEADADRKAKAGETQQKIPAWAWL